MKKRFRNILGPKIREWRNRAGLSQDELAAQLQLAGLENIDRVAVAKIESQIRSIYEYELMVFVIVLKVPIEELSIISLRTLRVHLPNLVNARLGD